MTKGSPPPARRATRALVAALAVAGLGACARVQPALPPALPPSVPAPVAPEVTELPSPAEEGHLDLFPARGGLADDPILRTSVAEDPEVQDRVRFWVGLWGIDQEDLFLRYLERMGRYSELVDDEIERRGLPVSLRFLPIVESGYLPTAVSRAGAVGLWQLMPPTARELGLAVSGVVDDRRDPVAATLGALTYLEQLHGQFDSWVVALAAYNAGPGRVGRLLDTHGARDLEDPDEAFLRIRDALPAETRDFVPRFLAAATLAGDPAAHGLEAPPTRPLLYDEVVVPDATSLDVVAWAAGVPEEVIVELNPHFVRGFTPPGEMRTVRVPLGRSFQFERTYALLPANERLSVLEHVVQSGDTFGHIAERYGVPLSELTAMNAGIDPRRLQIGARLVVPVGGGGRGTVAAAALTVATTASAGTGVHTVSSGESFWTISRRYGVSTEALAAANGKRSEDLLQVGERLLIP